MLELETQRLYEELQGIRHELKTLLDRLESVAYRLERRGQRTYILPVMLEDDETGGYVITSALLPGLVTEGDNREKALLNAKEAAEGLLEVMLEDGDQLPSELNGYQPGDELVIVGGALEMA